MTNSDPKTKQTSSDITVENVFKSIGGYSNYQLFATLTIISLEIPAAMISFSPILTGTNQINFYCKGDNNSILNQSEICDGSCGGINGSRRGIGFDDRPYVSIIQEWDLYCENSWITDSITSIQMFGAMLGPIATAAVADRYGRKHAFYCITILMGISGILSYYAKSLVTYGIARFVAGFAAGGGLVAHMNYLMEYLTPSWRVICGCVTLWPLGEVLLGVFGYFIPSWRVLTVVTSVPALLLLFTIPFLHESPRWLLCHNKTAEATRVFESIAKWNNRDPPDYETMSKLQINVLAENEQSESVKSVGFRDRTVLIPILILSLTWFANSITYLGISFNMKNMSGNRFVNVGLLGAVDFPAEISGIYFSNKYGRKLTFISTLAVGSVLLAVLAALQVTKIDTHGTLILVLCLLGKFCIEASWAVMACLTGEVFPTIIRSVCFSICSTVSCFGGIIAPQMAFLGSVWAPGPYIIFCTLSVASCVASMYLPEMRGKPLQDISYNMGKNETRL